MFGDIFFGLLWLCVWLFVAACFIAGVVAIISHERGSGRDDIWFGLGSLIVGVFVLLPVLAVATGEWKFDTRLLPDGCYRVGHEFSGKTTKNTFELIETCR